METDGTLNEVIEKFDERTTTKRWAELKEPRKAGKAAAGSFYYLGSKGRSGNLVRAAILGKVSLCRPEQNGER